MTHKIHSRYVSDTKGYIRGYVSCFELGAQRMHRSQFAESARRCSRLEVLGGARALEVVAGAGKRSQHPNYSVSGFVYHPGSMKNSILWYTTSLFRLSPIIKASHLPYKPPTPRLPTMGIQLEIEAREGARATPLPITSPPDLPKTRPGHLR